MTTKPFKFKSSKLSSAADQLWSASKSGFKADEKNIKLDLGKTLTTDKPEKEKSTNSMEIGKSTGFIFGSKLSEKVIVNSNNEQDDGSGTSKETAVLNNEARDDAPKSVSAVFEEIKQKGASSSFIANHKTKEPATDSESTSLSSSSLARENDEVAKSQKEAPVSPKLDEVEVVTGEEGEINIYRAMCKLHSFDIASKVWTERGLSSLRINERGEPPSSTYRIVGRVTGNQRVVLNSQIFPDMIVEKISSKRVKFSATTPDSEVPVLFLATASEYVAAQLYEILSQIVEDKKKESTRKRKVSNNAAEEESSETVVSKKVATES